jgi:signal transduction histidine kinase
MKKFWMTVACTFLLGTFQLSASAIERGTRDQAVALVKKAAAYLKENGKGKAYAEFSNPKGDFVDHDLYVFVYNLNGDGINRAHGGNPKLIDKNLLGLKDADGTPMIRGFLDIANTKGSGWFDYKWPNPVTSAVKSKSTYVERFGDELIGCGIYK